MATALYSYLLSTLRNSRLIGLQINCKHPMVPVDGRGSADDTTQLLLVYSYNNDDAYCLRLDLPHKGENYIHFNSRSPGLGKAGVRSCIFFSKDYRDMIQRWKEEGSIDNPEDYFIQYGQLYALKERTNCVLKTEKQKEFYSAVESEHRHVPFSDEPISEEDVVAFVQAFVQFFPSLMQQSIDSTYHYANRCFQCDRLLRQALDISLYCHRSALSRSNPPVGAMQSFFRTAIQSGILKPEELEPSFISQEGVDLVIDEAVHLLQPLFLQAD